MNANTRTAANGYYRSLNAAKAAAAKNVAKLQQAGLSASAVVVTVMTAQGDVDYMINAQGVATAL